MYKIVYRKYYPSICSELNAHYASNDIELVKQERDKLLASDDIFRIETWRLSSVHERPDGQQPWEMKDERTNEEEGKKPKYVCPNSQQHTRDGKGSDGFRVITDDVPDPHVGKIVCSVCGAHIKWESKAEMRKREAMTLGKDECECEGEDRE